MFQLYEAHRARSASRDFVVDNVYIIHEVSMTLSARALHLDVGLADISTTAGSWGRATLKRS